MELNTTDRVTAVTVKMLRKMLPQKYKYVDLTVQEVTTVISRFKALKPVMDNYVFNDGSSRDLMSLQGTVPVNYRENLYDIPVCIWLLDTFPCNPPICFVKPTSTMMIKTGKYIDANGKIYLPYMHEWKSPQSDLYGLIEVIIVAFSVEPPVFCRPTTQGLLETMKYASGPTPEHQNAVAAAGTSSIGHQSSVGPTLSTSDQTEFVWSECKPSCPLSTRETSPAVMSAPAMLSPDLASLPLPDINLSDESVLLTQKIKLEIDVLQRQKKVLEIQEQYYSIKLKRLIEQDAE